MKPMPWRLLVCTDAGADTGEPVRLSPEGGADAWLAAISAKVDVPKPGGGVATLEPRDASGFAPAAVRAALGAAAPAAAVDAALHSPAFQRLEAAYRGLTLLLEHAGSTVSIEVRSMPAKGIAARFRETAYASEREQDGLALVIADYDFSHKGTDLATLAELGAMCGTLQAPLVAHASAAFFDFRFFVQAAALPELLGRLSTPAHMGWREFQASDAARWVALTVNRFLLRAPWTETDGYAESCAESNPDSYLWGRGGWLVGAAVARSASQHGHALAIAGPQGGSFGGRPVRPFPVNANTNAPLATESSVTDTQLQELSRAACTPLVGPLRASVVMMPSVMTTFRLRPATPTIEGVLAYQIMAGRLAQFCGRMLGEIPGGDAAETAAFFKRELLGFLGPLVGEKGESAVSSEVVEITQGEERVPMAVVKVTPQVTLESKPLEYEFALPLR
jgi:hypothetical protein